MTGRVTPKGTKPKRKRASGLARVKGHYPLPNHRPPPGIVAPGMEWRYCTCGWSVGGSNAPRLLELHIRYGPQPELDAPCCQRWDVDDPDGWRTVRTCGADCDHEHEHYGEPVEVAEP